MEGGSRIPRGKGLNLRNRFAAPVVCSDAAGLEDHQDEGLSVKGRPLRKI